MRRRGSACCSAVVVAGFAAFIAAVAVAGTDSGLMAIEDPGTRVLTGSSTARVIDDQPLISANERIELADGGSRFSGASLRKKDAPQRPRPTASAPDEAREQAQGTDGECVTNSAETRRRDEAHTRGRAGNEPAGGSAPKKKRIDKKQSECKKSNARKRNKRKPLNSRDAETKARAGHKRVQGQAQSGLKEVIGNANRAAQAHDKLAPGIGPSPVSEDHVDLGSSDDLGE